MAPIMGDCTRVPCLWGSRLVDSQPSECVLLGTPPFPEILRDFLSPQVESRLVLPPLALCGALRERSVRDACDLGQFSFLDMCYSCALMLPWPALVCWVHLNSAFLDVVTMVHMNCLAR